MLVVIHYPTHFQITYKTMFFENYCKVLLSIDKKVFYREQFANDSRMKDNNVYVTKTSWKILLNYFSNK
jgi:hypothetical protein